MKIRFNKLVVGILWVLVVISLGLITFWAIARSGARTDVKNPQADDEVQNPIASKLGPALTKYLQTMDTTESVEVVIWVAGEPEHSEQDLHAILAAKYPEVRVALENSGNPFDVGDYDLMMTIKRDYIRMVAEDNYKLVYPAVEQLQSWGYKAVIGEGIPNIFATLPKSTILKLTLESWVGRIYLANMVEETQ